MKIEDAKDIIKSHQIPVQDTIAYKGGITVRGLVVGSGPIKPTIYENVIAEIDTEAQLIDLVNDAVKNVPDIHEERLYDTEYVIGHCISCVRPATSDATAVKWAVLDGEIEEYVRVDIGGDALDLQMTVVVTKELIGRLDVDEGELRKRARENLRKILEVKSFEEIMAGVAGEVVLDVLPDEIMEDPFYVVTTRSTLYGGGALLQEDLIQEFMRDHSIEEAYLIPSSTSEILIMPAIAEKNEIDAMIREVNETLEPCDVLGYHALYLNAA